MKSLTRRKYSAFLPENVCDPRRFAPTMISCHFPVGHYPSPHDFEYVERPSAYGARHQSVQRIQFETEEQEEARIARGLKVQKQTAVEKLNALAKKMADYFTNLENGTTRVQLEERARIKAFWEEFDRRKAEAEADLERCRQQRLLDSAALEAASVVPCSDCGIPISFVIPPKSALCLGCLSIRYEAMP